MPILTEALILVIAAIFLLWLPAGIGALTGLIQGFRQKRRMLLLMTMALLMMFFLPFMFDSFGNNETSSAIMVSLALMGGSLIFMKVTLWENLPKIMPFTNALIYRAGVTLALSGASVWLSFWLLQIAQ